MWRTDDVNGGGRLEAAPEAPPRSEEEALIPQGASAFGTWEWDLAEDHFDWSEEARRLLGLGPEDACVPFADLLSAVHPEDRELVAQAVGRAMSTGDSYCIDYRVVRRDGAVRLLHQRGRMSCDASGFPTCLRGIVLDVTEHGLAEGGVEGPAYDRLTGLPNGAMFRCLLEHALLRGRRANGMVAVLRLDIDRFHEINDGLGYEFGDRLLHEFSARLVRSLRRSDIVTQGSCSRPRVARQGGVEFMILLHDVRHPEDPAKTARRLLEACSHPFDIAGLELFLSISIGIAIFPADATGPAELLRCARIAKRSAKEAGGGTFRFFTDSMNVVTVRKFELEVQLRQALRRGELELLYQPLVDARTQDLSGVEALVRWQHPQHGMVLPLEFVPLAEESDLIVELGAWVIRTACRQFGEWRQTGLPDIRLAINVSSRQLRSPGFAAMIAETLQASGIGPQRLELELTERSVVANDEQILAVLCEL